MNIYLYNIYNKYKNIHLFIYNTTTYNIAEALYSKLKIRQQPIY